MLIDYVTERSVFSQSQLAISLIAYALAGAVALFLRRWGQVRSTTPHPHLGKALLRDLPSGLWEIFFFLLTGCLKGPLQKDNKQEQASANRRIFFGGIRYSLFGFAASFLLMIGLQVLNAALGGTLWEIPLLFTKASACANLSLIWFSVLPLPCSDAEFFLRRKPFGKKEETFRSNGTLPFFLYCTVGLLLACIPVSLADGTVCSFSGLLTLFPILLIGG